MVSKLSFSGALTNEVKITLVKKQRKYCRHIKLVQSYYRALVKFFKQHQIGSTNNIFW